MDGLAEVQRQDSGPPEPLERPESLGWVAYSADGNWRVTFYDRADAELWARRWDYAVRPLWGEESAGDGEG